MNCFTCLTCRVVLPSGDSQRVHYKQEWHSYNLKRKLAALPPVTSDQFQHIARLHQPTADQDNTTKKGLTQTKTSPYCESCGKQFNNDNAFAQHMQSKKHKALEKSSANKSNEKKLVIDGDADGNEIESKVASSLDLVSNNDSDDSDWESIASDEEAENGEPIAANQCLFCEESSGSIDENVNHMTAKHSFFIPDVEYLKDLEPFLSYLGEKVGFGHFCLWCCHRSKQFRSRRATQQHMRDKGHTKMCHSGNCFLEYSNFYDYSKSYPDHESSENQDEEVVIPHLDDEDWQLSLPSGAVIGHRSLFKYYKQNLKPSPEYGTNQSKSSALLDKVLAKYRSLGWTGITGEAALQRAKDIKYVQKIQRKYDLKVGMKNNKNYQNYFRSQMGF